LTQTLANKFYTCSPASRRVILRKDHNVRTLMPSIPALYSGLQLIVLQCPRAYIACLVRRTIKARLTTQDHSRL